MGIAIIVPGVNWANRNLGQVTPQGNVPIQAMAVVGNNFIIGQGTYSAELFPVTTTERSVVWSIVSGSEYATIDQEGKVSAKSGAIEDSVTIRATSASNPLVFADKTITVTTGEITYYDYMESDGACRYLVDGGFSFGTDFPAHKVILRGTFTTGNGYVFGGQYERTAAATRVGAYKRSAGDIGVAIGVTGYTGTGVQPVGGKVYRVEFNFCSATDVADVSVAVYDDDTDQQLYTRSDIRVYLNSDLSFFVYGYNQAGAGTPFTVLADNYSANRLYGFEVYDNSNNKIMDLKIGSLVGTPILLDEVSSKIYYNLGEGTPTLGND